MASKMKHQPYILAVLRRLAMVGEIHGSRLSIIEIGVYKADLTVHMLTWFPKCHIIGVDPWAPYATNGEYTAQDTRLSAGQWARVYHKAQSRLVHVGGGRCELLRLTSDDARRVLEKRKHRHHLIFIDGLHTREQVFRDATGYYELLAPGGIMGGHDFGSGAPGVEKALRAIDRPYQLDVGGTWWYEPKYE